MLKKWVVWVLIVLALMVVTVLWAQVLQADELHVVDVDRLTFEDKRVTNDRDPYFPGKSDWYDKYDLYWNVRLFNYFFWENDIESLTDYSQFREVGWHFTQGIWLYQQNFAVVHEHYSRHALDESTGLRYPLMDAYGIRINFINK